MPSLKAIVNMAFTVNLKESVVDDLRWFGGKDGRRLIEEAEKRLSIFVQGEEFKGHESDSTE